MKHIFTFLLFLITPVILQAQVSFPYDTRSDSIDVHTYEIHLDVTDFTTFQLKGNTLVKFRSIVNGINKISLDLEGLTIDSVKNNVGTNLTYTPRPKGYIINLSSTYNANDSTFINVYYHGTPVVDGAFGGYYFNANFSYNVGVSLSDIPHNYGRTWFPCFDEFTTRSKYETYVTVPNSKANACGGILQSITDNGNGTSTYHWKINQRIPSYLVSTAVSNYVFLNRTFTNYLGNPVPVMIACRATDTNNVNGSFVNLENAFDIFENKYGPYQWDRVGYSLVPMTGGAMEHCMNIAYPLVLTDGSTSYQDVVAHELAHSWWGNLVTCRTAEDMWINEGSAVYSEYLFNENLNGRTVYNTMVRNQHKELIRMCHINDNGYWPLSGVPQAETYGYTTYPKGADMIHTLRHYLGDSLFFSGVKQLLEDNKYSDIDAIEYRDDLGAITGVNLNDFFQAFIFQPGWVHAQVDSIDVTPSGLNYNVAVNLRQKLVGRSNYSNGVKYTITFMDDNFNSAEYTVLSNGQTNSQNFIVPFSPTVYFINRDEKVSHAVTADYKMIKTTGAHSFGLANMNLNVTAVGDSNYVVVEQHWAHADSLKDWTKGWIVNPQRYWRVDGVWDAGFATNATVGYNGRTSGTNAYLDNLLITTVEDSLVLLYRRDRSDDWVEFPTYTKTMGSPTDKAGSVSITNLMKGEYCFAMKGLTIGMEEYENEVGNVYPNPAYSNITIESKKEFNAIEILDVRGNIIFKTETNLGLKHTIELDSTIANGIYFVRVGSVTNKKGKILYDKVFVKKIIVRK